jgi:hypothetical protein
MCGEAVGNQVFREPSTLERAALLAAPSSRFRAILALRSDSISHIAQQLPRVRCASVSGFSALSAAGHVKDSAGNVGGFLGQEPQNGAGDLFGLAAALHWH